MILAVSSLRDEHAAAVLGEIARLGGQARLLDLSQFPEHLGLSVEFERGGLAATTLRWPDSPPLDLACVGAIWWRRPQPFGVDLGITRPAHRAFAYNESHEAIAGLWNSLQPFWINHPARDEVAARKLYQLHIAAGVNLQIPDTLITNDVATARQFIERLGVDRTVYKAFSATSQEWRETRLLKRGEISLLENVRYAPVIFQEYVPARVDVRVTIVGEEMFAAAIHSQETAYPHDFRMDMNAARVEAIDLPRAVTEGLRALMSRLGLVYGAVDMRTTPEGHFVFLEINPAGQWLFIEQRTGQRITMALAKQLVNADLSREL